MHKSYKSDQKIDKHLKSVNTIEYRIKSNLTIKIGRIGSIVNSRIQSLKRIHNTNRKDYTKSMAVKEHHSHEISPHESQGKTRSHTFFLVR